jgi:hypothetical protein
VGAVAGVVLIGSVPAQTDVFNASCVGWSSEQCSSVADVFLVEMWLGGRWTGHTLCVEHAKMVLDTWVALQDPPEQITVYPLRELGR